jgi:phosphoglycerate dehydrogenase-like enzyme
LKKNISKPKAILLCDSPENIARVYGEGRLARLKTLADVHDKVISKADFDHMLPLVKDSEYIFSTWGMPVLTPVQIKHMKKLKAVFFAAGSVKYFAEPFLKAGIKVVSAWSQNAVPTADFAFAQVILSCKGYFRNSRDYRESKTGVWSIVKQGIYGTKVGIIGAGQVGRRLMEMLGRHGVEICISDPLLTAKQARQLGARKTSLKQMFKECQIISNHMPDIKETKGTLGKVLFSSMPKNATFINTGRGAQVKENDLISVFKKRKDLTALLDVTFPEPPDKSSELFSLPNVIVSPHIAGAYGKEQLQLADYVMDEFEDMLNGKPLKNEIKTAMLKNMG